MLPIIFACAAVAHGALFLLTLRLRAGTAEWIVRGLLLGVITDNTILALSPLAFTESWYYTASEFRYLAHVLLLPPLAYAALLLAGRAGIDWAVHSVARWACLGFVVAAILFGLATEVVGLELVQKNAFGHDRYVSAHGLPPFATILTNVVVLVIAASIWRRARWPWLFLSALAIFVVNASAGSREWGIIAGNLAEVVFLAGWVASLQRLRPPAE